MSDDFRACMSSDHTFVILAYKDSPYLEDCISSVLRQTTQSTILISTSTYSNYIKNIGEKYSIEIRVSNSPQGIANDWNFAVRQASTRLVTLAHQDDIYEESYVKNVMDKLNKYPDSLIGFTGYFEIRNGTEYTSNLMLGIKRLITIIFMPIFPRIRNKRLKQLFLAFGNPISCPTVVYNLQNIQNLEFDKRYKINLDWEMWTRLARFKGSFVHIGKKLVQHRIHPNSETTSGIENNQRLSEDFEMFSMFWPQKIAKLFCKIYSKSYDFNQL